MEVTHQEEPINQLLEHSNKRPIDRVLSTSPPQVIKRVCLEQDLQQDDHLVSTYRFLPSCLPSSLHGHLYLIIFTLSFPALALSLTHFVLVCSLLLIFFLFLPSSSSYPLLLPLLYHSTPRLYYYAVLLLLVLLIFPLSSCFPLLLPLTFLFSHIVVFSYPLSHIILSYFFSSFHCYRLSGLIVALSLSSSHPLHFITPPYLLYLPILIPSPLPALILTPIISSITNILSRR